jgi:hypothetical protein
LILAGTWLSCAVAAALPFTLWWGHDYAGRAGMIASAVAALLCWTGSIVALWVRTRFPKPQDVVAGTLGAMLVRMVLILGGAMLIASVFPGLVKATFWGQVVVYFLVTLAAETLLAVRWAKNLEAAAMAQNANEEPLLPGNSPKAI